MAPFFAFSAVFGASLKKEYDPSIVPAIGAVKFDHRRPERLFGGRLGRPEYSMAVEMRFQTKALVTYSLLILFLMVVLSIMFTASARSLRS
jgi:hypothetical protein